MSVSSIWLFRQSCDFKVGAASIDQIPPNMRLPEVAFVGRSNVGKSSLLNALTGQNSLARTSKTPGCTRQINFFSLADHLMLVDLPGYGYAKASKKEVKGWNQMILDYLTGRPNLSRVFVLVDSRHGIKPGDRDIMSILDDFAVSYQIILTKTDKQKQSEIEKIVETIRQLELEHTALHPEVLVSSAREKTGIGELRNVITQLCV